MRDINTKTGAVKKTKKIEAFMLKTKGVKIEEALTEVTGVNSLVMVFKKMDSCSFKIYLLNK